MTAFEFLSVALSFVLGLAVTLVMTSLLAAFRARGEWKFHGLSFVWAGFVLVYQFQYWWAIYELSSVPVWTVSTFGLLLLLAVILFLAGGLILPTDRSTYPRDLGEYFRRDGRWGVFALTTYSVVGASGNMLLFDVGLTSPLHMVQLGLAATSLTVVLTERHTVQWTATAAFGVLLAIGLVLGTPAAY